MIPDHIFSERIWRGWLIWTGYSETDMPYDYCRAALSLAHLNKDARTMVEYMEAWMDGYREALKDLV
jgi:hypothetical protein